MAEQPPHTSLLVLNLKILRLGSWKEKGRVFSQQNLFGTMKPRSNHTIRTLKLCLKLP